MDLANFIVVKNDYSKGEIKCQVFSLRKTCLSRERSFVTRTWQTSRNGNAYLRIKGHTVVLFELSRADGTKYGWKYAFDKHFSRYQYATKEEAMRDAFDELEAELAKN